MILPYLGVQNSEVFNAARTLAYLRQIDIARESGIWELAVANPCDRLLYPETGTDPYPAFVDPATDFAETGIPQWYDPDYPESAEFLGMLITDITGLSSVLSRSLTDISGGGGKLGPQRHEPRRITVKGVLVGSPCGTAYGKRWTNDYLRGQCQGCTGYTFEFFKCCPGTDDPEDGLWCVVDAGLTSFLVAKPLDPRTGTASNLSVAGCDMVEVEFEITAANPYLYKNYIVDAVGGDEVFSTVIAPPLVGTTCFRVIWEFCTEGKLTIDGGATTILEFAGLPADSIFWYDTSAQDIRVSGPSFTVPGNAAQYITSLGAGEPLPWLTLDAGCDIDTVGLKAEGDASTTVIQTRHREG